MKSALNTERFFQSWLFIFVFGLSIFSSKANALSVIEKLTEQNYRTLSGRVRLILESRFQGLPSCSKKIKNSFQERFSSLTSYSNKKEDVVQVLDLYRDSLKVDRNCRESLDIAEMEFHSGERKKFSIVHSALNKMCESDASVINPSQESGCFTNLMKIVREIDPHCMTVTVPNPKGYYDGFPCISGDNLIGKFLYQNSPLDLIRELQSFFRNFQKSLEGGEQRQNGIETYWDFLDERQDSLAERKKFLAVIALLTSSTSSYGSYIEGYHDHAWRSHLIKTGSSEEAVDIFNRIRIAVNEFQVLNERIQKQKIKVTVASQNMNRINRHDYMSAFLACYYTEQGSVVQNLIPKALGYSYETFDFLSHLREGTSVKDSRAGFARDTRRYREGAAWGAAFCRQ